jgi:hypothetical protein
MAEIGAKFRHMSINIHTFTVPSHQGFGSEAVAKIMQTWSVTVMRASQSNLS